MTFSNDEFMMYKGLYNFQLYSLHQLSTFLYIYDLKSKLESNSCLLIPLFYGFPCMMTMWFLQTFQLTYITSSVLLREIIDKGGGKNSYLFPSVFSVQLLVWYYLPCCSSVQFSLKTTKKSGRFTFICKKATIITGILQKRTIRSEKSFMLQSQYFQSSLLVLTVHFKVFLLEN